MSSSGVEFEEDAFAKNYPTFQTRSNPNALSYSNNPYGNTSNNTSSGMAGWLIRHHIVKSSQGAQLLLIGIIIINLIITAVALFYFL